MPPSHIVDEVSGRREAEFVADVAAKMPMAAICEMLGVERATWPDVFHWTNEFLGAEDPEYQEGRTRRETWQSGMRGLMGAFRELIEKRRVEPADDVMTTLVEADDRWGAAVGDGHPVVCDPADPGGE